MKALDALPTTLQGMYTRVLETVETSSCYREALFMLQYVLWAKKPPLFSEMVDAVAVRLDENPGFKQENRLFDLMDVITQCSSLLTPFQSRTGREIHLAHSSVKEYLTSRHLVEPFQRLLSEVHARSIIAKTSMRYMVDVASIHHDSISSSGMFSTYLTSLSTPEVVLSGKSLGRVDITEHRKDKTLVVTMDDSVYPFLRSASYWAEQAQAVEAADDDIPRLVMQVYEERNLLRCFPQILGLGFIQDWDEYEYMRGLYIAAGHRPSPLIHACYWGLEFVAQQLLEVNAHLISSDDVDSPLHAASFSGHHSIVQMLLGRGAAVDGCKGSSPLTRTVPLHGAARNGHIEVVKTLLQHGARIDILGFEDETAIEVAVRYGHRDVAQLLLASCDSIPFYLFCVAISRSSIDREVVDLLCSKPVVTTSSEYSLLMEELLRSREKAHLRPLSEKGLHVPFISSSTPSSPPSTCDNGQYKMISRNTTGLGTHWMEIRMRSVPSPYVSEDTFSD
jgi:hypothetical protein